MLVYLEEILGPTYRHPKLLALWLAACEVPQDFSLGSRAVQGSAHASCHTYLVLSYAGVHLGKSAVFAELRCFAQVVQVLDGVRSS